MHLLKMNSKCWAKSSDLISAKLIENHLDIYPIDLLVDLAYYMMRPLLLCLESLTYKSNQTVKLLYKIVTKGRLKI